MHLDVIPPDVRLVGRTATVEIHIAPPPGKEGEKGFMSVAIVFDDH
jgi:hypothetical protein